MTRLVLSFSLFASLAMAQPPLPAPAPVRGYLAQIASGGTWKTTLTLYNPTLIRTLAVVVFRRGDSDPLLLPLTVTQGGVVTNLAATELSIALQPLSNIILETESTTQALSGYAEVVSVRRLGGSAVLRQRLPNGRIGEAVVPLEYSVTPSILIPFDTRGGQSTGVAIVNPSNSPMSVVVRARNENGAFLSEAPLFLTAHGRSAFDLNTQFELVNVQGTVEIVSPIIRQILGLGLRFSGEGVFTSIPVLSLSEPISTDP